MALSRRSPHLPTAPVPAPRPLLAAEIPRFIRLEREVEDEFRPAMLGALQRRVEAVADSLASQPPGCPRCGRAMAYHDARSTSWLCRFGRLRTRARRYRCPHCRRECRPLLEVLGVEAGRISGSLARLLAVLGVVVPYELAARLALLCFGVKVSPMGVWRVVQRLGEACEQYGEALARYHADSHSTPAPTLQSPAVVVLGVDGCALGMQVRAHRRRRDASGAPLPALLPVEEGQFREVKTGVLLLPAERVEPSPGRHALIRRFLVSCLGDADGIFSRLWARLQELGWLGPQTLVVIVGDGAEWIWKRAEMFVRRCEILDFWHAVEHAWEFARLQYGDPSTQAARWVHRLARDLRDGKVHRVIARLKTLRTTRPEVQEKLDALIRYYTDNAARMRYDEYLRLGYGIGSGAVESAHKQLVHARLRQAGMRWSERGARRLLALRVLLLNGDWAQLDRLPMVSVAA
jgi:hypothetical protein